MSILYRIPILINKIYIVERFIRADGNAIRVAIGEPITCSRAKCIFTFAKSAYAAVVPQSDVIISAVGPVGATWVDEYANHEVFSARERFSIAIVLFDIFPVGEVCIDNVGVGLEEFLQRRIPIGNF